MVSNDEFDHITLHCPIRFDNSENDIDEAKRIQLISKAVSESSYRWKTWKGNEFCKLYGMQVFSTQCSGIITSNCW